MSLHKKEIKSFSHYYRWMRKHYPDSRPYRGYYRDQYLHLVRKEWDHRISDATSYYLTNLQFGNC